MSGISLKYHASEQFTSVFEAVKSILGIDYAVVGRIAIALSLSGGARSGFAETEYDKKGKEFNEYSLDDRGTLHLLCSIEHGAYGDEDRARDAMEFHLNRGLRIVQGVLQKAADEKADRYRILELLANYLPKGPADVGGLRHQAVAARLFAGSTGSNEPLYYLPNTEGGIHNNAHAAIAGGAGVGKSQLLLSLIVQGLEQSRDAGCLLFDYKGDLCSERNWDVLRDLGFKKFILGRDPFPVNPLRISGTTSPGMAAQSFAEICKIHSPSIGTVQIAALRDALTDQFSKALQTAQAPTFAEV